MKGGNEGKKKGRKGEREEGREVGEEGRKKQSKLFLAVRCEIINVKGRMKA